MSSGVLIANEAPCRYFSQEVARGTVRDCTCRECKVLNQLGGYQ